MKKTAKVMISLLMIAALLCCLCACGKKDPRWWASGTR